MSLQNILTISGVTPRLLYAISLIAGFMRPTWGPSGADRTQVGPMLAPWTLQSGLTSIFLGHRLLKNVHVKIRVMVENHSLLTWIWTNFKAALWMRMPKYVLMIAGINAVSNFIFFLFYRAHMSPVYTITHRPWCLWQTLPTRCSLGGVLIIIKVYFSYRCYG